VLVASSCLALGDTRWSRSRRKHEEGHRHEGRDWLAIAHHALALGLAGLGLGVAIHAATSPDPVGLARPVAGLTVAGVWALLTLLTALYPPPRRSCRRASVLLGGLDAVRRLLALAATVLSALLLGLQAHAGSSFGPATAVAAAAAFDLMAQTVVAWIPGPRAKAGGGGGRWRWWRRQRSQAVGDDSAAMPLVSVLEDEVAAGGEGEDEDDVEQLESHASVMSRLTFWWVTPLLSKGYRARTLGPEDLPHLERHDQPPVAHAAFRRQWARGVSRASPQARAKGRGGYLVLGALMRANWRTFSACGLVLLASTVLQLTIPVVLNRLLAHIDAGQAAAGGAALGYTLAVGLFVLVVLQSMTEHQFWIWGIRCGMRCQVS
jgi:hypothetical protein